MTLTHLERAACLDSSVHGGWDETRKQAGAGRESHRELSSLPEPRTTASGAPLQGDGIQQSNATRSAPGEGPGHICCPGSLAPGLGEPAGTPGWGISAGTWCKLGNPLHQGSQCRHREVCGACGMLTGCSLQQSQWGLGQADTPSVPSSARLLAADRVAVALGQDRSLALTRVNRGPERGCKSHGRTGCAPPGNLGRSRLSWLPRAHTGQQMAHSTPRLLPFQNNHPQKGKWQ